MSYRTLSSIGLLLSPIR